MKLHEHLEALSDWMPLRIDDGNRGEAREHLKELGDFFVSRGEFIQAWIDAGDGEVETDWPSHIRFLMKELEMDLGSRVNGTLPVTTQIQMETIFPNLMGHYLRDSATEIYGKINDGTLTCEDLLLDCWELTDYVTGFHEAADGVEDQRWFADICGYFGVRVPESIERELT